MKSNILKLALDVTTSKNIDRNVPLGTPTQMGGNKVSARGLSYNDRHRGQWFRPEYDLDEIQIAQDTDGYIYKAIQLKVNRFMLAGWEFVGLNDETLNYIKSRIVEIEALSGQPFDLLLAQTAQDLVRFSNCMWVKVRDSQLSSGKTRKSPTGKELQAVAGYFILPFETLQFKLKANGEIKKILQKMPGTANTREFSPEDVIHFYTNKKPGFAMGTPELLPVVGDVALLRSIEESIEELIDSALHPVFHWKVGSDNLPERIGPDGVKETDVVRKTIEYMPAGGMFVSDHRHNITAVGSEGRALRIEGYLDYFKKRVFAGLGVSSVDMGEGDTANRATAQTLSKRAIQDIEALQLNIKIFLDNFVIRELLLEGGYGIEALSRENKVSVSFGAVDKEEKSKIENQTIQLFLNKLITESEARERLGERPYTDEDRNLVYFNLYEEPLVLLKSLGATDAGDDVLVNSVVSSISKPATVKASEVSKQSTGKTSASGAENASAEKARPSNQYGRKTSPKFTQDLVFRNDKLIELTNLKDALDEGARSLNILLTDATDLNDYKNLVSEFKLKLTNLVSKAKLRVAEFSDDNVNTESILKGLQWRLDSLVSEFNCKAYDLGVKLARLESEEQI